VEVEGWERRREAGKSGEGKEGGEGVSELRPFFRSEEESREREGESFGKGGGAYRMLLASVMKIEEW